MPQTLLKKPTPLVSVRVGILKKQWQRARSMLGLLRIGVQTEVRLGLLGALGPLFSPEPQTPLAKPVLGPQRGADTQ